MIEGRIFSNFSNSIMAMPPVIDFLLTISEEKKLVIYEQSKVLHMDLLLLRT